MKICGDDVHRNEPMRSRRIWMSRFALFACALFCLVTSSASADSRVVVRAFRGPKGPQVRAVVVRELKERGFEVVSNKTVDEVAKERGLSADDPAGRTEAGRELMVNAWIDGSVKRWPGQAAVVMTVQEGHGLEQLAEVTVRRRTPALLPAGTRRDFWKMAGPAIEAARPPETAQAFEHEAMAAWQPEQVAPASTPASDPAWGAQLNANSQVPRRDEHADSPEQQGEQGREVSVLEMAATMNTLNRTLHFRESYALGVPGYRLAAAPVVSGSARFYPGALVDNGVSCCIGLDGSVQRAFGLASESADGVAYDTSFEAYTGSVIARYPFARHEVNALVGYGFQRFLIESSGVAPAPVPGVAYRQVRVGAGGQFALGSRTRLGFDGHWLVIVGTGPLGSDAWFPNSTGNGVEGNLYLDVRFFGGLAARARASYQRSVLTLRGQREDQRVASGAVDSYVTAGLGLAYTY